MTRMLGFDSLAGGAAGISSCVGWAAAVPPSAAAATMAVPLSRRSRRPIPFRELRSFGVGSAQDLPFRDISEGKEVRGELCVDTKLRGAVEHQRVCRPVIVINVVQDIEARHRRDDARIDVTKAFGIWA